jgi:hypothetical protein
MKTKKNDCEENFIAVIFGTRGQTNIGLSKRGYSIGFEFYFITSLLTIALQKTLK